MQTQRITFLTSPEHKAELDAFAARSGQSVGNIVREATRKYIAQPSSNEEEELAELVAQVNQAIPKMNSRIDEMSEILRKSHEETDAFLRQIGIRA